MHEIRTVEHPPIQLRPYRRSVAEYEEINRQVQAMLKDGIIQESMYSCIVPVIINGLETLPLEFIACQTKTFVQTFQCLNNGCSGPLLMVSLLCNTQSPKIA